MLNSKLIENLVKSKAAAKDANLQEFIRSFYSHSELSDLGQGGEVELEAIAVQVFEFFKKRELKKPKIELHNPNDQQQSPRTYLMLLNDDKPFLVDSVNAELSRFGLKIHKIFHPVMNVVRDKAGKFVAFDKKGTEESLIFIEMTHVQAGRPSNEVVAALLDSIQSVYLAVDDWRDMVAKANELKLSLQHAKANKDVAEADDFLAWLSDNHFTFLSYVEYQPNKSGDFIEVAESRLGLAKRSKGKIVTPRAVEALAKTSELLEVIKSDEKAIVHRSVYMDQIGVKKFNSKGEVVAQGWLSGLFASSAYYQSTDIIPLIRQKVKYILGSSGFANGSHAGKIAKFVLDSYPRDEIFQASQQELQQNVLSIVDHIKRPRVGLYLREDKYNRFITCLIYVPKEKFDTNLRYRLQDILQEELGAVVTEYYTQISDSPLSRLYLIMTPNAATGFAKYSYEKLKRKVTEAANVWSDSLQGSLFAMFGSREGERLYAKYENAFPTSYRAIFQVNNAVHDIKKIEECIASGELEVEIYQESSDHGNELKLKGFNPRERQALSDIVPVLENVGLRVIEEKPFIITPAGCEPVILREFETQTSNGKAIKIAEVKQVFEDALKKIANQKVENDSLNKLALFARLAWRDIVILRAYSKYIKQLGIAPSLLAIQDALTKNSELSLLIVQQFHALFGAKPSKAEFEKLQKQLQEGLKNVDNLTEDFIIRAMAEAVAATLRTNFLQADKAGNFKDYISFKLRSSEISFMPKPTPFAEIFVYSPEVEGIHLRGGAVARGGLRWSDRNDDFRTEVLGLMKAQMVKNSVIVPTGSKGGFVCKKPLPLDRDARQNAGIAAYKTFLSGLLDITDNLVNGKVVPPKQVVRRDGDDPYLVVAADKGTATFSDIANGLSQEYGFWLDDAFASGGSVGYDHKAMGITAKGGWVSVERHFRELGLDTRTQNFTVAGIGDMAGDVFGNGMLLSEHICLVAAFNHMHIFIDPTPNAKKSFEERKRMFALPRSSWEDYNKKLISEGGGIFNRSAKTIALTPQICKALSISEKTKELAPDALIKAILTAPVDLLWNGGIGTYVKAKGENNAQVGDKANDQLRINGEDLCCRVVGEGGNLGFTQLGRIEFAKKGGKINTDAIDNSAGVDCSDHEVNIKIALAKAVEDKKLTTSERNKLLEQMTDEVAKLVLRDNYLQTQAISIAEQLGVELVEPQLSLIKKLEKDGALDRELEFLPSDDEFAERKQQGKGLSRPELAVLLSYSKIDLYSKILASKLPDEPYYTQDLISYFPENLQKKFTKYLENHQLKREIIATSVTNSLINRTNSTFLHSIAKDTGMEACDIARAYTVARDAFGLRKLWREIEALDGKVPFAMQAKMLTSISSFIDTMTLWFLNNLPQPISVEAAIAQFAAEITEFEKSLKKILPKKIQEKIDTNVAKFVADGVPAELAQKVAALNVLASACDVVLVAKEGKMPLSTVAKLYFEVGNILQLSWLRDEASAQNAGSYWERLAMKNVVISLYEQQRRIATHVIKSACKVSKGEVKCDDAVVAWQDTNSKELERHARMLEELKAAGEMSIAMLVSAVRRIEAI